MCSTPEYPSEKSQQDIDRQYVNSLDPQDHNRIMLYLLEQVRTLQHDKAAMCARIAAALQVIGTQPEVFLTELLDLHPHQYGKYIRLPEPVASHGPIYH